MDAEFTGLPILRDTIRELALSNKTILDLGCGILEYNGREALSPGHFGVEGYSPYVDVVRHVIPVLFGSLPDALLQFPDKCFDMVLAIDVLEHLVHNEAEKLLQHTNRLAKRAIVIFTPRGFVVQDACDVWGLGVNDLQAHKCGYSLEYFLDNGYTCSLHDNIANGGVRHQAILAIKVFV